MLPKDGIVYYCEGMKFWGERVGLKRYNSEEDINKRVVFLGLYFDEDYKVFSEHKGQKIVYCLGSDILRLQQRKDWLEILKSFPEAKFYCDNYVLRNEMLGMGIDAKVDLLFYGDINKYPISYKHMRKPRFYLVAHPGREEEYGVPIAINMAASNPDIFVHIYGIDGKSKLDNLIFHGLVEESVMDKEIKHFQSCLRFNAHDGISHTVLKSILMGQYPIQSHMLAAGVWWARDDKELAEYIFRLKKTALEPNYNLREVYLRILNKNPHEE